MENAFIWILTIALIIIIGIDQYRFQKEMRKCPNCEASLFDIKNISNESVGEYIKNSEQREYRTLYRSKKCNHTWSHIHRRHKNKSH